MKLFKVETSAQSPTPRSLSKPFPTCWDRWRAKRRLATQAGVRPPLASSTLRPPPSLPPGYLCLRCCTCVKATNFEIALSWLVGGGGKCADMEVWERRAHAVGTLIAQGERCAARGVAALSENRKSESGRQAVREGGLLRRGTTTELCVRRGQPIRVIIGSSVCTARRQRNAARSTPPPSFFEIRHCFRASSDADSNEAYFSLTAW